MDRNERIPSELENKPDDGEEATVGDSGMNATDEFSPSPQSTNQPLVGAISSPLSQFRPGATFDYRDDVVDLENGEGQVQRRERERAHPSVRTPQDFVNLDGDVRDIEKGTPKEGPQIRERMRVSFTYLTFIIFTLTLMVAILLVLNGKWESGGGREVIPPFVAVETGLLGAIASHYFQER